jgi:ABC-type antimicrobial peptide transport system permease subunit
VVRDVRERGYELAPKVGVYQPAAQTALPYQTSELVVRVANDPADVVPEVRRVIAGIDPGQPVAAVRTMDDVIDLSVAGRRQQLILLGTFAGLALLLACVGLYGLLSYGVTQRSREIGLRMALGADAGSVVRMVMGRGMLLTAAGLAGGLGASWALTRWMKNLLYGVRPTDLATFCGVVALFALVAAAACFVPARRASRLDPIVVLREE